MIWDLLDATFGSDLRVTDTRILGRTKTNQSPSVPSDSGIKSYQVGTDGVDALD